MERDAQQLRFDIDGRDAVLIRRAVRQESRERFESALTASEHDVACLALRGRSNRAIAERRGTSVRTVANQLRSAFRKLGIRSRAELGARLLPEAGTDGPRDSAAVPEEEPRGDSRDAPDDRLRDEPRHDPNDKRYDDPPVAADAPIDTPRSTRRSVRRGGQCDDR